MVLSRFVAAVTMVRSSSSLSAAFASRCAPSDASTRRSASAHSCMNFRASSSGPIFAAVVVAVVSAEALSSSPLEAPLYTLLLSWCLPPLETLPFLSFRSTPGPRRALATASRALFTLACTMAQCGGRSGVADMFPAGMPVLSTLNTEPAEPRRLPPPAPPRVGLLWGLVGMRMRRWEGPADVRGDASCATRSVFFVADADGSASASSAAALAVSDTPRPADPRAEVYTFARSAEVMLEMVARRLPLRDDLGFEADAAAAASLACARSSACMPTMVNPATKDISSEMVALAPPALPAAPPLAAAAATAAALASLVGALRVVHDTMEWRRPRGLRVAPTPPPSPSPLGPPASRLWAASSGDRMLEPDSMRTNRCWRCVDRPGDGGVANGASEAVLATLSVLSKRGLRLPAPPGTGVFAARAAWRAAMATASRRALFAARTRSRCFACTTSMPALTRFCVTVHARRAAGKQQHEGVSEPSHGLHGVHHLLAATYK